jgi:mannitol/fructose-specific phosphotransferase system IIA component
MALRHTQKYCDGENNELVMFGLMIDRARTRKPNMINNLTPQHLKEVWERQQGICPYTGLKLILPRGHNRRLKIMARASLDRIESSKGYEIGNVQFVSVMANFAKNDYSHEQMVEFCTAIAKRWVIQ